MTERTYITVIHLLTALCAVLLPASTWLAFGTSMFIQQAELRVDGHDVYFKRYVPLGSVTARWASEIHVLDGTGLECSSGEWGIAVYQSGVPGSAVTYQIGDWADHCLARNSSYTITTVRQVLLWGIPLRPSTTVDLIEVGK